MSAAGNQRQSAERSLEQLTDELWFLVVECNTAVAVGALLGTVGDLLVVRLRHASIDHRAERRSLGRRTNEAEVDDTRRWTLKLRKLE